MWSVAHPLQVWPQLPHLNAVVLWDGHFQYPLNRVYEVSQPFCQHTGVHAPKAKGPTPCSLPSVGKLPGQGVSCRARRCHRGDAETGSGALHRPQLHRECVAMDAQLNVPICTCSTHCTRSLTHSHTTAFTDTHVIHTPSR